MLTVSLLELLGVLQHEPSLHEIQGIGDSFIAAILDEVVEVFDNDAIQTTRQVGTDLGLLVSIGSGANVWAARRLAENIEGNIATVLPDRAERYFSCLIMNFGKVFKNC